MPKPEVAIGMQTQASPSLHPHNPLHTKLLPTTLPYRLLLSPQDLCSGGQLTPSRALPTPLYHPCPSRLSHSPPSSPLTEHAEPGRGALAALRERGEVAGVVGFVLGAQSPHDQRCVP